MTRTYAARRLFEHGPLTVAEFREITGWKSVNTVGKVLCRLRAAGAIRMVRRGKYEAVKQMEVQA